MADVLMALETVPSKFSMVDDHEAMPPKRRPGLRRIVRIAREAAARLRSVRVVPARRYSSAPLTR